MSIASPLAIIDHPASWSDRVTRGIAIALAIYLSLATWPVWRYTQASGGLVPLVAHVAILGYTLTLLAAPPSIRRPALDWLVLTIGPVMYIELRWIIAGLGMTHRDAVVIAWEAMFFPTNPSVTLAPRYHSGALSELLHLAYAAYYLLVYMPAMALYARRQRDAFVSTMLAFTIVYGACFLTYAFFPVDGPRYLVGPAAAPDGPIRSFVLGLLDRGSSRGTAFPSSHVAASVVSALCAMRFQRRIGIAVSIVTALLTVATVYGGFHYAVDAIAGALLGASAWGASLLIGAAVVPRGAGGSTAPH